MLLILFSIGHVLPSGAVRFLLCVGCDDVGYSINLPESTWSALPEQCCETEIQSSGDELGERTIGAAQLSDCDCVHITISKHDTQVIPGSSQHTDSGQALRHYSGPEISRLDLTLSVATPRGPPDLGWSPATATLLGQHTGLLL